MVIATDRLILRNWQPADRVPFAELNSDSRVMQFMPGVLSRAESDELAARISEHLPRNASDSTPQSSVPLAPSSDSSASPYRVSQRTSRLA